MAKKKIKKKTKKKTAKKKIRKAPGVQYRITTIGMTASGVVPTVAYGNRRNAYPISAEVKTPWVKPGSPEAKAVRTQLHRAYDEIELVPEERFAEARERFLSNLPEGVREQVQDMGPYEAAQRLGDFFDTWFADYLPEQVKAKTKDALFKQGEQLRKKIRRLARKIKKNPTDELYEEHRLLTKQLRKTQQQLERLK